MEWDKLDHAVIAAATGQWRRRPGVPAVDILSTVSDLLNHCICNDFCCFIKGCVSNDSCSFCCLLMSFIYFTDSSAKLSNSCSKGYTTR